MVERYDVVIVGLGVYGLSVARAAAHAGLSVLGVDQFDAQHTHGSSHGESRVFRFTTVEADEYVSLAERAGKVWAQIEHASQTSFITRTGLAVVADREAADQRHHGRRDILGAAQRLASQASIKHERLTSTEFNRRFSGVHVQDDEAVFLEHDAFVLRVEPALAALEKQARIGGARIRRGVTVSEIIPRGSDIDLRTQGAEVLRARNAVVCVGPWTGGLAADTFQAHAGLLQPQVVSWYKSPADASFPPLVVTRPKQPLLFAAPEVYPDGGIKIVAENLPPATSHWPPLDSALEIVSEDELDLYARQLVPGIGPLLRRESCVYTVTGDSRLKVDRAPQSSVFTVMACSGHGFKYAPAVAERIVGALTQPLKLQPRVLLA